MIDVIKIIICYSVLYRLKFFTDFKTHIFYFRAILSFLIFSLTIGFYISKQYIIFFTEIPSIFFFETLKFRRTVKCTVTHLLKKWL